MKGFELGDQEGKHATHQTAVFFGLIIEILLRDAKHGGVVHGARVFNQPTCHHRPEVLGGIGETEAAGQLRKFFQERR